MTDRLSFSRQSLIAAVIGIIAVALGAAGLFVDRGHALTAYLWAYLFWLGISLGAMAMTMVHSLTGGHWGTPLRRILEAATGVVPLMAVLFVPIVLGQHDLFIWARPEAVAAEEALRHRAGMFHLWFFGIRAVAYFAIWIALAIAIRQLSWNAESLTDLSLRRLRKWSAIGLVAYLFTMTHAGVDWIMSRDIHFYSTAFGFVLTTGQTLAGFAFALILMTLLARRSPALRNSAPDDILIDQGNILMTLVVLWAYVSFFQFLVIWMGNTREDNAWYLERGVGGHSWWKWVGVSLMAFHFAVPFTLLLFRTIKRQRPALVTIAALIFVAHIVEQAWLILPSSSNDSPILRNIWMDLAALLGIGGLWMAWFLWDLGRRPLLPREIPEAVAEGAAS